MAAAHRSLLRRTERDGCRHVQLLVVENPKARSESVESVALTRTSRDAELKRKDRSRAGFRQWPLLIYSKKGLALNAWSGCPSRWVPPQRDDDGRMRKLSQEAEITLLAVKSSIVWHNELWKSELLRRKVRIVGRLHANLSGLNSRLVARDASSGMDGTRLPLASAWTERFLLEQEGT